MTQWQSESVAMAQYDYWRTCIIYTYRHIHTQIYTNQNTLNCVLSAKHLVYRQYTQAVGKKNTHTYTLENHIAKIECNTAAVAADGKWNIRAKQWQTVCIQIEWMNMHTNAHAIFNRTKRIFVILNLVTWYLYLTFFILIF